MIRMRTFPSSRAVTLALAVVFLLEPASLLAQQAPAADRRTTLQGTVMIDRRHRVVGAVVQIRPEDDPTRVYLTSTDDDGDFEIKKLPEGTYRLTMDRVGFHPVLKDGVSVKFPFRAVVEVTMIRNQDDVVPAVQRSDMDGGSPITVTGIVSERAGAPMAEARLRMVHPVGELDPHEAQSDANGGFTIDRLAPGRWELEIDAVGFLPLDVQVDLTEDTQIELWLVRQPADYEPSPLELMPPEKPTPPPGFESTPTDG